MIGNESKEKCENHHQHQHKMPIAHAMSVNPLQPSNAGERLWSDKWMCISERSGGCVLGTFVNVRNVK